MSNKASRVGIGMKMCRNEILAAARMRQNGDSWAKIGKAVGVSASTARKTVRLWGADELLLEMKAGGSVPVRCGGCGWSSSACREPKCTECGSRLEFFPERRR